MLTENKIQTILTNEYVNKRRYKLSIPNIYLYSWESDLISINKDYYVIEYEIKISRHDYIQDFDKSEKHRTFRTLKTDSGFPNYFYYVCPDGLIKVEDIPEYAGLIYIKKNGMLWYPTIIKKAPILHNSKFDKWEQIATKLYYKLN